MTDLTPTDPSANDGPGGDNPTPTPAKPVVDDEPATGPSVG